jgi:hypothetical protein
MLFHTKERHMGTNYQVQIVVSSQKYGSHEPQYQEAYEKARKVFLKHNCDNLVVNDRLSDVGKWDWEPTMREVCAQTKGLEFAVFHVSENGDYGVDYYISEYGFVYNDRPKFAFNKAMAKAQMAKYSRERREEQRLAKAQLNLKEQALKKLSPEERSALGLGA